MPSLPFSLFLCPPTFLPPVQGSKTFYGYAFFFSSVFRCVIVPKGFEAAGMLLELNRKIKKILKKVVIYQLVPGVGLGAVRACAV